MRKFKQWEWVWNNELGHHSRQTLLSTAGQGNAITTTGQYMKPWHEIPEDIQQALVKIDWEFCLGHRLGNQH